MPLAASRFLDRVRRPVRDAAQVAIDGPFRALRHADFRRFAVGQGISLVGTWMQTIAQGWLVLDLTHSAFAVGLTTTLGTLPILVLTLYGGVVADRVDRRRFIMIFQSVMLVPRHCWRTSRWRTVTVTWIWGLAVVFGLATAFEVPARQAYPGRTGAARRPDFGGGDQLHHLQPGPRDRSGDRRRGGGGGRRRRGVPVNALSYVAVLIGFAGSSGARRARGRRAEGNRCSPACASSARATCLRAIDLGWCC